MRNHLGFIALSLLAAAFAGCSSADKDSTSNTPSGGDLAGALAKYNSAIVPLANDCVVDNAKTKVTYTLESKEILVLSLRSVDSALLANGKECVYTDAKSVVGPMTTKALKYVDVLGDTGTEDTAETLIVDIRNGIFAAGNIKVDLMGQQTDETAAGDEIAVLGAIAADKMLCSTVTTNGTTTDVGIDLNADKTADIKPVTFYLPGDATPSAPYHYTIDLNSGDDTFDQGACVTSMSVYGSAGKDTITIGSSAASVGDVFSGGTDGATTESVDTITFAARAAGIHVTLDTTADDGAGNGLTEKDKILGDFEVVTGTKYDDVLVAGNLGGNAVAGEPTKASAYTLNGSDGNDVLASQQNYGTAFNGGAGVDTVTYAGRAAGVTVTMDGKTADDGEKAANGGPTAATLDNVAVDIENLIGSDLADKITGNASNNWFKPGAGSDVVVGGDGDDLMLSGKADGSDAADGDDIFQGGVGNDTIDYSNRIAAPGVTVNLDCAFTAATVAGTKSAGTASGAGGESDYIGVDVENVVGTVGDDTLNGSSVPNSIWSMGGEDSLAGGAGSDQLDANAYEGTYVTANGYQCDGSLVCYDGSDGSALGSQPADCDCKTPTGYRCAGNTTDDCIDPATGDVYGVAPGDCDCDAIAGNAIVASTCNPVTAAALDGTVINVVGVTCLAGSYDTGTCDAASAIVCGGDPMDVATCTSGDNGQFTGCWKTQI
jgi:Ca2+-binding RTX toxin-like protein